VQRSENVAFPRTFNSNIRFKHQFRYTSVGTLAGNITQRSTILNLLGVATTTTQVARLFAGVKINRIEIFGVSGSGSTGTTASTVSLEWLSEFGPSSEMSDTGNAFNPPHLVCTPPPQSTASFWSLTGSNEGVSLFSIAAPAGSVVDLWLDVVLFDAETPTLITSTSILTVGGTYAGYLTGSVGAGTYLIPVSYQSYSQ
jgi:hypothetical protein